MKIIENIYVQQGKRRIFPRDEVRVLLKVLEY